MRRSRRRLGALVLSGLALAGCRREARPAFDSLVLVTIDTLRADHLGAYGYPRPTSPAIDALAREGVVFERAIASSSHTAPAHATLLTSLHPEQHQVLVNGERLDARIPTLAGLLSERGFDTAGFVSVRFLEGLAAGFGRLEAQFPGKRSYRPAGETVELALAWLEAREARRRFALWVHVYDPHEHGPAVKVPEPDLARMGADSARRGGELLAFVQRQHGYQASELHGNFDRYDAQIAFADAQLGRLFEALRARDPAGRTLVVVTADHGEGLGNHGYEGHGQLLYNEQLRVPLVLWATGGRLRPARVGRLVRHVDVLPTALALLGVPLERERLRPEGRSVAAWLDEPNADVGIDAAFSQRRPPDERRRELGWTPGVMLAAQDERFKYIFHEDARHEFYDLEQDPFELTNRIDAELPQKERLREWLLRKFAALVEDHRTQGASPKGVDPRFLEDLRALGYL